MARAKLDASFTAAAAAEGAVTTSLKAGSVMPVSFLRQAFATLWCFRSASTVDDATGFAPAAPAVPSFSRFCKNSCSRSSGGDPQFVSTFLLRFMPTCNCRQFQKGHLS